MEEENPLQEEFTGQEVSSETFSPWIRTVCFIAGVLSNPFLIPLIGTWVIVKLHYFQFIGFQGKAAWQLWGIVLSNAFFLPVITVFLLWRLKFISSLKLQNRKERIIPFITTMTFYFWAFLVFKNQVPVPDIIKTFFLGNFIAVVLSFLSNIKMRVSMHMVGLGGLVGLLFSFIPEPYTLVGLPLALLILLTGIVASSRMILRGDSLRSLYMGLAFGVFSQLIATWFV